MLVKLRDFILKIYSEHVGLLMLDCCWLYFLQETCDRKQFLLHLYVLPQWRAVLASSFFLFFNFTVLYWFSIPLGRPSASAPSIQYRASNLDWWLVSYLILYMFQCHSPKSSHPLPLPQSPKDCSMSLLLSPIQGYCYHLYKFHIYAWVYYIGVFLSGLLHSV